MLDPVTICVVDDDDGVRQSLDLLLRSVGMQVEAFDSARAFLEAEAYQRCACLICDIRMPEMTGLELQDALAAAGVELDIIMLSGHGDVPTAVRAIKNGAFEFLEKPFDDHVLMDVIARVVERRTLRSGGDARRAETLACYETLTPRERDVMAEMLTGAPNKLIGHTLGVSPRTVEVHRSRILQKMEVRNLSQLVRRALEAGIGTRRP